MSKTLAQWLAFIEQSHPKEIDMGLSRTKQVLDNLDLDMRDVKVITVAGTNGKGTTCTTIESILNSCNINTGRYASPHMLRFNERIVVNQQEVSDANICIAFEKVKLAQQSIPLTYFEYATLAALVCFFDADVDVIILEVGLGGRLDATNVIDADVAVLTSIGLDHQDWLGDSLQGIANEKAGIVKATSKVVIGFQPDDIGVSYCNHPFISTQKDALLFGRDYCVHKMVPAADEVGNRSGEININTVVSVSNRENHTTKSLSYPWCNPQVPAQNVMAALASVWQLISLLAQTDTEQHRRLLADLQDKTLISKAINEVRLPGRVQTLSEKPLVIADVAHNQQAAEYLRIQLLKYAGVRRKKTGKDVKFHFVVGMLKDKNIEATLQAMSAIDASWYACSIGTYRGESAQRIVDYLTTDEYAGSSVRYSTGSSSGGSCDISCVMSFDSVKNGIDKALESAKSTDIICVFGSFVTVADAIPIFLNTEVVEHV